LAALEKDYEEVNSLIKIYPTRWFYNLYCFVKQVGMDSVEGEGEGGDEY
jgi:hypothetical protein